MFTKNFNLSKIWYVWTPPPRGQFFRAQNFVWPTVFFYPKFFFASKFLLDPKFFWPKIIFDPKILFWPKHFLTNNYFEIIIFFEQKFADPKFIWIKYFSDQNFFWPTNFWTQNITPIFFGPNFFCKHFVFTWIFLFNLSYVLDQKFFNGSSSQTPGLPKLDT